LDPCDQNEQSDQWNSIEVQSVAHFEGGMLAKILLVRFRHIVEQIPGTLKDASAPFAIRAQEGATA
jgi:hypothetical protein